MTREEFEKGTPFVKKYGFGEIFKYESDEPSIVEIYYDKRGNECTKYICLVGEIKNDGFEIQKMALGTVMSGFVKFEDCETLKD
jgi:hypothetical protein